MSSTEPPNGDTPPEDRPIDTQPKSEGLVKKTAFDWKLFDNRADVLRDLRERQEFVDLMLMSEDGGQEVTHFAVVSALGQKFTEYVDKEFNSSDVVEVTLDSGFVVKKVLLKNVSKDVLKIVVDCAYSGFIDTKSDHIWQLIETAELYGLEDVLYSSLTYLARYLNTDNCVQVFHLGLKYRHKLSNASYAFIRTHFSRIVFDCKDFPTLSVAELGTLLGDDELNIRTEQTVFDAIIRWTNHDIRTRGDKLSLLLSKYLRFVRLELAFIDSTIATNPLIKCDRICTLLVNKFKDHYKTYTKKKDGNGFYVGLTPIAIRPRVPHEVVFVFGGWQEGIPTTLMETFDVRCNQWFDTKLSNDNPRAYHGIETINGLIFVMGGTDGTQILDSVLCFNPISQKWYERRSMTECRCYVSTAVVEDTIYAMGGHNGRQRIKTCETYDIESNVWTRIADMNMSRSDASAAVHQNKIYIAGGLNDQLIENTVEVYDPIDKTWSFIQPMSNPRTSLGFMCLNESLYAIGGNNGFERLNSVERFDFNLRSWLPVANMKSKRSTFATTLIEGDLYVIGGYNGQTPICLVEKYDPKSNVWTEVKSLKHDRSGLSVCVVKGLSNASDYTYIGRNEKKVKNRIEVNEKNETNSETSNGEMEID